MKQNLYYLKFFSLKIATLSIFIILMVTSVAFAQVPVANNVVKGKVTDAATNQPLPGAKVMVKGTTTGVATDVNGNFTISTGTSATVLVFSYIGYKAQEILINNQTIINVKLQQDAGQLKDVVITAMNQTKDRRALGYSVSEVKGASLTEARENSFVNSLEGRVAGVSVSGVATGPNGASNVVIRGITNMTGNNQPLYVVNGIPLINNNYN